MTRLRSYLLIVLFFSAVYLFAWPRATLIYEGGVLLHFLVGLAFAILVFLAPRKIFRNASGLACTGWILLLIGTAVGIVLIFTGTLRNDWPILYVHIMACLLGAMLLAADWAGRRGWLSTRPGVAALPLGLFFLVAAGIAAGSWWERNVPWESKYRISNPPIAPASMNEEGGGPHGPFFPSSAESALGGKIPVDFFLESETCRRCHADIYRDWSSSAHHFSSFNNQWYRKSIEYMQDTIGIQPSKLCAGCHDPALLFTGLMDRPVREIEHTPSAQAGLGCMMCHSIVAVQSTMGQGGYVLEYPALHDLAVSKNPFIRHLHDFLVRLNPEPHRRTFLKPFMRNKTAQFCSACHKVHLDVPVNRYRWVRGFNEYDNWQASGVSGQGARSFYYPPRPQTCADCHMPLIRSHDFGNFHGWLHSHRFIAANTALPFENEDATQLRDTVKFLQDKQVSLDIFAVSPEVAAAEREGNKVAPAAPSPGPAIATTFGVGEESEFTAPRVSGTEGSSSTLTAPLDRVNAAVRRGETVRVDVVVRTRKLGHFFPGGTVDAYDLWLELVAQDETGRIIFWSGVPEDGGAGPVDPGAHFYRALLIDAHGNPISKRNAWAERAVVYVRLIPPGAADVVHYRLRIPRAVGDRIRISAKLNYRKFDWWFTQFAFAGVPDPKQIRPPVSPDFDDTRFAFTGSTAGDSGKRKGVPSLPIVTLAENTVELRVLLAGAPAPAPRVALEAADWQRWNDYGIGLLLQGDLRGADAAFGNVARIAPQRPDGWVNLGRARLQEGNLAGATEVLERALRVNSTLASAHFFYAMVLRDEGRYGDAAVHLRAALSKYPRDRVARNELGRIFFLERRYAEAIQQFQKTLEIDPEDLQANYNLMLCYTGLGDTNRTKEYEMRYLRFKADEASEALTGAYLLAHPYDNNERQPIHEHVSVPLDSFLSRGMYIPLRGKAAN